MSTRGVKRLMTSILVENQGRLSQADYQRVIDYAKKGPLTDGEKQALLRPSEYLGKSRYMRSADIGLADIQIDPGAYRLAKELADTLGLEAFTGIPSARDTRPTNDLASLKAARDEALGKGTDLGTFKDWSVQTTGADVKFAVDIGGSKYPALVLDKPQWKDPKPRDLLTEKADAFKAVSDLAGLKTFVDGLIESEAKYFAVDGVEVKSRNERYGIMGLRRKTFINEIRARIGQTALAPADRAKIGSVLFRASEALIDGHDFAMDTGSHTNYWPYWNNYADFLVKVLDQTDTSSDDYLAIKNRLGDIFRRKTVFSWNRSIDEKDFETSLGGALVFNPQFSAGDGHRVSVKDGSTTYDPKYELLSVKTNGLPDELEQYAGAQVFRNGDKLYFDHMGEKTADRTGKPIPAGLADHIQSEDVTDLASLNVRKFVTGESARKDISADWNQNGAINIAKIMIGWWGHCHNEAPANAKGIDPQKGVEMYRADRGVDAGKATARYSAEDAWDVVGAFTADHEEGYGKVTVGNRLSPTRVDDEVFIGNRNNGGHWLNLSFDNATMRRVRIDAEVTGLWHKSDPSKKYANPMERFRRDVEKDDGTFEPNPDWVSTNMRDNDQITIDAKGRQMTVKTKFITLNSSGMPFEKEMSVHLDPSKDEFVHLADELSDRRPGGGGKVIEHWYNPKTAEYKSVAIDVNEDNGFERKEIDTKGRIATKEMSSAQETTYDSVMQIHDFVTEDIGLPFTFDTSAGMAVWNYPVKDIKVDVDKTVEKVEDGKTYTYTTYRLKYDTMGGPSGDVRYTIKRDDAGKMVRALALDPMPDFAYRYKHWVSAPVALDVNGDVAYNLKGLNAGYMTDKARRKLVTALWERQASILYASLSDDTAKNTAYVFETEDGRMVSFGNKEEYDAAVAADMKVRQAEATAANPS